MQRYFIEELPNEQNEFTITGNDAHHIARVMRMQENDRIIAVFKNSTSAECSIQHADPERIICRIDRVIDQSSELPVQVTIAHGLPKGDKLELVIQKSTELGAYSFMPFKAERSIVKWDGKKGEKKIERWNKIAKEAAEQSHRNHLPEVKAPHSFKELLGAAKAFDKIVVAYEEQAKNNDRSFFAKALSETSPGQSLLVVIGPEGGLSPKEVVELEAIGAVSCGFGPRILRSETAPLYALAAISYQFELMR
ncbi:16S rRNA (uracil(1498)-N(3))-methyltransferase [Jeotgalibacillus proteolyticus]|uniref:Ribosomal RNA small subunit methyltransferase E n=1 Tax=Jeotgalibacillus proteolyticus TaxID=2082395 RepID=A0A2S5GEK3_9BACL|nr:16S rRNA (uracil(1498)-N(3))-methyltransferase [Jeotgalibacillus proteolyticus]PPA71460.1 16S rRNA (uracil(1498)-N(3))-methyltransferase [Jeotgalibacillus proteolyticus]